jgi:hypothetical protein
MKELKDATLTSDHVWLNLSNLSQTMDGCVLTELVPRLVPRFRGSGLTVFWRHVVAHYHARGRGSVVIIFKV